MEKYQQAPTGRWELVQSLRKHWWEWAVVLTAAEGAVITHWSYYSRMWVTGKTCERTQNVGSRQESPASPGAMGDRWKAHLDLCDLQDFFSRRTRKRGWAWWNSSSTQINSLALQYYTQDDRAWSAQIKHRNKQLWNMLHWNIKLQWQVRCSSVPSWPSDAL